MTTAPSKTLLDDLLGWVARDSMANRGATADVKPTVPGVDWATLVLAGSANAKSIVEQRFPKPTPACVAWRGVLYNAPIFGEVPLPAVAFPVVSTPLNLVSAEVGLRFLVLVEWSCGGARFKAFGDASGGCLSLPGVDWVRVAYLSDVDLTFFGNAFPQIHASIIPSNQNGGTCTVTSQGLQLSLAAPSGALLGGQPWQKSLHMLSTPGGPGEDISMVIADLAAAQDDVTWPTFGGPSAQTNMNNTQVYPVGPSIMSYAFQVNALTISRTIHLVQDVRVC